MTDNAIAEARRLAAELGLSNLDEPQLAQLAKCIVGTRALTMRLPKDLHWSEEPAVIPTPQPSQRRRS